MCGGGVLRMGLVIMHTELWVLKVKWWYIGLGGEVGGWDGWRFY